MADTPIPPALEPAAAKRRGRERVSHSGGGHLRTILALMLREMSSRYGRTPGGYIWAIFEPLGMILMLAFGFSLLTRSPPLGNSFLLFYATGYLPFSLFLRSSRTVMMSLVYSQRLLNYPAVTWFDAVAARAILNILTDLVVAFLLMTGILLMVDTHVILDFAPIAMSFALAAFLGIGFGTVNCVASGFFPVYAQMWNIGTRPLFLASGIIFMYEDLPTLAKNILWFNPLMHVVSLSREGYFPTYTASFMSLTFVLTLCLALTTLGLLTMRRYQLWLINKP